MKTLVFRASLSDIVPYLLTLIFLTLNSYLVGLIVILSSCNGVNNSFEPKFCDKVFVPNVSG